MNVRLSAHLPRLLHLLCGFGPVLHVLLRGGGGGVGGTLGGQRGLEGRFCQTQRGWVQLWTVSGFHTPHSPSVPWCSALTKVSGVAASFGVVWLFSYKDRRGEKRNNSGNTEDVFTKTHVWSYILFSLDGDSDSGTTVVSTSLIFFWAFFFPCPGVWCQLPCYYTHSCFLRIVERAGNTPVAPDCKLTFLIQADLIVTNVKNGFAWWWLYCFLSSFLRHNPVRIRFSVTARWKRKGLCESK